MNPQINKLAIISVFGYVHIIPIFMQPFNAEIAGEFGVNLALSKRQLTSCLNKYQVINM